MILSKGNVKIIVADVKDYTIDIVDLITIEFDYINNYLVKIVTKFN